MEDDLSTDEKVEFYKMINDNPRFQKEYEEQKKVKGALMNMSLKNPGREFWDNYWLGIYNRIERGIAWILISLSAIVIAGYGIYEAISNLLAETKMLGFLKYAIIALVIGAAILIFSLIRERIAVGKKDKYKEIQR